MATATLDLFVMHQLDYARRLAHAGGPGEIIMHASIHSDSVMAGDATLARRYVRDVAEASGAAPASAVTGAGQAA